MSNEPTSTPDGTEAEMKQFQGTWKQIAYERDGVAEPPDEQGWDPSTTFTGEEFVVTLTDGSIPIKGTYRIDPTHNPKTVDWTDTIGEDAGKTLLAIYTLQGDRLIFCAASPGLERPTEFGTRPGQVLRVFQRVTQKTGAGPIVIAAFFRITQQSKKGAQHLLLAWIAVTALSAAIGALVWTPSDESTQFASCAFLASPAIVLGPLLLVLRSKSMSLVALCAIIAVVSIIAAFFLLAVSKQGHTKGVGF